MLTIPVSILLCLYGLFIVYILIRLFQYDQDRPQAPKALPFLSVVVPFKNEARNLGTLCESLAGQDYDGEWEVVLVNDGSSDDFALALARFRDRFGADFTLVDSHFDPAKNLTSKQQALDAGIETTRGDWIVLTDADMTFVKGWLSAFAANAAKDLDLVFGHTALVMSGRGLFGFLQRFQLEFLFATAYAFHAAKLDGSCMGNNLLIRKKAYQDIGGQKGIGRIIVEDRALYKEFHRRGRKTAPIEPFTATAFTSPCDTLPQFYHQMLRWARGGFASSPLLLCAAVLFTFQNISLFSALCGAMPFSVTCLSVADFLLTMFFTALAFRKIHSRENVFLFPTYLIFSLMEAFVFCVSFVITPQVKWKNNKV
jgi:cellulose synthase/poly-beta-1,6-N-acetylglucosamine synthase-like glycosyltransferase